MSFKQIDHFILNEKLWILLSASVLLFYLSALLFTNGDFYVLTYDNLDSTVVWYKILAQSGMIFADNNATIPNMMNGLPRASYMSEFNVILWLYYFFSPVVAFVINEVTIHLVAFFSMFVFLKSFVITDTKKSSLPIIYTASLYFALIPFWSGAGISLAAMPLVTYALLKIKNYQATKLDWLVLLFVPFYSSFVLVYIFYIALASVYLIYDSLKYKKINIHFFLALFLFGSLFVFVEYRLFYMMFVDPLFVSHRIEFSIFYNKERFIDFYRAWLQIILESHTDHYPSLQLKYVWPMILSALLVSMVPKRLNRSKSVIVWLLIVLSFSIGIWSVGLNQLYTIPFIIIVSVLQILVSKKYSVLGILVLFTLLISFLAATIHYKEFLFLQDLSPIFQSFNTSRIAYIHPFLFAILLSYALYIFYKKLSFSYSALAVFLLFQFTYSLDNSFYKFGYESKYASFQSYYDPALFAEVKQAIDEPIEDIRVASYGLEPAVSLYNGFYTIDGYAGNYPLSYKHQFRKVNATVLDATSPYFNKHSQWLYDKWGSKLYILGTTTKFSLYKENTKGTVVQNPLFVSLALCQLEADYLLSAFRINTKDLKLLELKEKVNNEKSVWEIYLYKVVCK